jgi:nucleotide-binding universal stress UspA family protein
MSESAFKIAVPLGDDVQATDALLEIAAALVPPSECAAGRILAVAPHGFVVRASLYFPMGSTPPSHRPWGAKGPCLDAIDADSSAVTPWHGIVAAVREAQADLLLLDWHDWAQPDGRLFGVPREEAVRAAPCNVAAVKRGTLGRVRQVLLPVRGGPQGLLTLHLAMGLAERHDAMITLLHVEQPGTLPEDDAAVRAQLDALLARGAHPARAQSAIVIAGSIEAAIASEAEAHQVTIMGASPGDPGTPLLLGPVAEAVAARVAGTLIIEKARE